MTTYILDIETDTLNPSIIWCVVMRELHGNGFTLATKPEDLPVFFEEDRFVTHNGVDFDIPVLNRLWKTDIQVKQIYDTLVMSRLFNPKRKGGHSLESWGERFSFAKVSIDSFDKFTEEIVKRCKRDVEITEKLFIYLKKEGCDFSSKSVRLEHKIADIISKQSSHGFYLDRGKAEDLLAETYEKAKRIEMELKTEFKPKPKIVKEVVPKIKKDGSMSTVGLNVIDNPLETVCGPFTSFKFEPFNLASPKQIIERLDACGWNPVVFTPKGSPKICEENLDTISDNAPSSAKKLAEWKMLESRWKTVESWLDACHADNKVHGRVFTMGAVTGRMTHSDPNMANVVSADKPYGKECRECFTVSDTDNYRLVGMDAKGLELRMLAHYMNDPEYINIVLHGDPHTANQKAAGLETRAQSKTFIYAFLYGAGAEKLGNVVGGTVRDGSRLKSQFLYNMPSLSKLITKVQKLSTKKPHVEDDEYVGVIEGLDGRQILIRYHHAALNTLLQGAGAIVCKQWSICMDRYIKKNKLDAHLVNTIHDELQYEVHVKDVDEMIEAADKMMQKAGKILNVRLTLNADAKVGRTWAETH